MTNPQAGRLYILAVRDGYTARVSPPPFASDEPPSCSEKGTTQISEQLSVVVKTHVFRGMPCRETSSWGP